MGRSKSEGGGGGGRESLNPHPLENINFLNLQVKL